MKKAFFLTGLAALGFASGAAGVGIAQPPAPASTAPAAPPPAAAPVPAAPAAAPAPSAEEIEASRRAVGSADIGRLLNDRAYAATLISATLQQTALPHF